MGKNGNAVDSPKPIFTFVHIRHLGTLYWLLVILFCTLSMTFYQFMNISTPLLQRRFNYSYERATELVTLIPMIAAITIPIFSSVVVFIGCKAFILTASSIFGMGAYSLFYYLPIEESPLVFIGLVMVAIHFAFYSSVIWTSLTLSVPQEATSIALAIATVV